MEDKNRTTVKYQSSSAVGLMCMLTAATIAMHQFKVPMIMNDVAESLNMSHSSATWLMSVFTLIGIVLALPSGTLAQKVGSKNLLMVAAALAALGSVIGGLSTNGAMILVSRAIEGIGFIFVSVSGPMTIASYCEPSRIGGGMGIWSTWVCIGQIVAYNTVPSLFSSIGWKNIWFIFAALSVVMIFVTRFGVKAPQGLPKQASVSGEKVSYMKAIANKNLILASLAFATFNYMLFAVLTFFPAFATQNNIMGTKEAAFVATIPMIGAIIGGPLFGKISESVGRKKIFILAIIASGLGLVMCFTEYKILIYVGAAIFGVVGLACPGMILGAVDEIVGDHKLSGIGTGVVITCQNIGMFLATATFMSIVDAFNGNFALASYAIIPVAVVGVILAVLAKFK